MKRYALLIAFSLIFIVPYLLHSVFFRSEIPDSNAVVEFTAGQPSNLQRSSLIRVKDNNRIIEMELDTYVLGVLMGEVPASFETEALKAQAVATRTYTLRRVDQYSKHDDAHVCTDAACCQAYMEMSDYLSHKGNSSDADKLQTAVVETSGQVLTYEGNLIEATYFSCSGGQTEEAVDVWGTSVPYLQSVASPGEEEARHYCDEIILSRDMFLSKLGLSESVQLSDNMITASYTKGGGVETLSIGEKDYSGTQIRTLLSLSSTVFTVSIRDDTVVITTKGNGHRVGMSQYGADAMAVTGKKYDEILMHYYPGTKLETFTSNQMNAVFDKAGNL